MKRRVLWFTNTPSLYEQGGHHYHGGGWMESLERLVVDQEDVDLGVAFFHATDVNKLQRNKTTYFPIRRRRRGLFRRLIDNWSGNLADSGYENRFMEIVRDFQPDVIQVFGSEGPFGAIQTLTTVPVVIHLQGLINPYLNAYFPVGYGRAGFFISPSLWMKNLAGTSPAFSVKRFRAQAKREEHILRNARHVCGRTHWDRMIAEFHNPDVTYFHIDEVLRPDFHAASTRRMRSPGSVFTIVSTLSPTVYKGIDVMLRAAKLLCSRGELMFRWHVIGLDADDALLRHFERKEGVRHKEVNITCMGRRNAEQLRECLSDADVFVHPSYIDNSPNSVCEAQMVGIPVVACDVGGVASLIDHGENGYMVPANGVFETVHYLEKLAGNPELRVRMGRKAALLAGRRHDPEAIVTSLLSMYAQLRP